MQYVRALVWGRNSIYGHCPHYLPGTSHQQTAGLRRYNFHQLASSCELSSCLEGDRDLNEAVTGDRRLESEARESHSSAPPMPASFPCDPNPNSRVYSSSWAKPISVCPGSEQASGAPASAPESSQEGEQEERVWQQEERRRVGRLIK